MCSIEHRFTLEVYEVYYFFYMIFNLKGTCLVRSNLNLWSYCKYNHSYSTYNTTLWAFLLQKMEKNSLTFKQSKKFAWIKKKVWWNSRIEGTDWLTWITIIWKIIKMIKNKKSLLIIHLFIIMISSCWIATDLIVVANDYFEFRVIEFSSFYLYLLASQLTILANYTYFLFDWYHNIDFLTIWFQLVQISNQ